MNDAIYEKNDQIHKLISIFYWTTAVLVLILKVFYLHNHWIPDVFIFGFVSLIIESFIKLNSIQLKNSKVIVSTLYTIGLLMIVLVLLYPLSFYHGLN